MRLFVYGKDLGVRHYFAADGAVVPMVCFAWLLPLGHPEAASVVAGKARKMSPCHLSPNHKRVQFSLFHCLGTQIETSIHLLFILYWGYASVLE